MVCPLAENRGGNARGVELPSENEARQDQVQRNPQVWTSRDRAACSYPRPDDFCDQAQSQEPQGGEGTRISIPPPQVPARRGGGDHAEDDVLGLVRPIVG